jgi:hypothetical protein
MLADATHDFSRERGGAAGASHIRVHLRLQESNMKESVVVSWIGGKDSSLALREIMASSRYKVVALLTTVNPMRTSRFYEGLAGSPSVPVGEGVMGASLMGWLSSDGPHLTADGYQEQNRPKPKEDADGETAGIGLGGQPTGANERSYHIPRNRSRAVGSL